MTRFLLRLQDGDAYHGAIVHGTESWQLVITPSLITADECECFVLWNVRLCLVTTVWSPVTCTVVSHLSSDLFVVLQKIFAEITTN